MLVTVGPDVILKGIGVGVGVGELVGVGALVGVGVGVLVGVNVGDVLGSVSKLLFINVTPAGGFPRLL